MKDKLDTLVFLSTAVAVLLAFLVTGERDYADAVTADRDALRAQLEVCRAGLDEVPAGPRRPALHLTRAEGR